MSWLELPLDTPFGLANLPYGVFSREEGDRRVGVAVGDAVLDLSALAERLGAGWAPLVAGPVLNPLLAAGPATWREVREQIGEWLGEARRADAVRRHLVPADGLRMYLPFEVADYVDFYSSRHHAENVGRMFRPDSAPLTPNWTHLPIGYHGRAGTVVVSGTEVVRPQGQRKAPDEPAPAFGPTRRLDIEAEVGFVVGVPSTLGEPVPLAAFEDHVFGACLVNDWSARDVQAWEYVPLGPFLGKSFATSVSPWIVPLAALQAARVAPPARDPRPLPYLRDEAAPWGLDLALEVRLNGHVIARPPFATMYWTAAQQLAHLTVNGASLRTGDLFASGTVSGPEPDQRGSLLELTWNGRDPLTLPGGEARTFLEDGDEVTITATAPGPGGQRIGFGEVRGRVAPSR
ncbi:fumarylacetoacetase [Phytohabitans rumicis]|uniref:fumarylacetoacetase n=1 Tax=Phytohabitans rumicis TaxID=1076125 RepID=A0A6V8LGU8_9ACTN|nr:fumarylacetoacetase [Phytohabitans rumicis]GFJ94091.1 fumarylacetoacetase [Phytohabitans rumicis]